jgi:hypothetical protein
MTNAVPPSPELRPLVRGWLLVLCLGMTVLPAVFIALLVFIVATAAAANWTAAGWVPLLVFFGILLTLYAPAMVIGTLLWMRKRAGLIAAKVYFAACLMLSGAGWLWAATQPNANMGKATVELLIAVAVCGLWSTYLSSSERVRATFEPPKALRQPVGTEMQSAAPQTSPVLSVGEVVARAPIQANAPTSDDEIYEIVANEINGGNISKGLWTRLYAEADGEERKTRVLYIKHRSAELLAIRDRCLAEAAAEIADREAREAGARAAEAERAELAAGKKRAELAAGKERRERIDRLVRESGEVRREADAAELSKQRRYYTRLGH